MGFEGQPCPGYRAHKWGDTGSSQRTHLVSDRCMVTVDMRLVPPYTSTYAQEIVEKAARYAKKSVPKAKISYCITGDRPYIEKYEDSKLLQGCAPYAGKLRGNRQKRALLTAIPILQLSQENWAITIACPMVPGIWNWHINRTNMTQSMIL